MATAGVSLVSQRRTAKLLAATVSETRGSTRTSASCVDRRDMEKMGRPAASAANASIAPEGYPAMGSRDAIVERTPNLAQRSQIKNMEADMESNGPGCQG